MNRETTITAPFLVGLCLLLSPALQAQAEDTDKQNKESGLRNVLLITLDTLRADHLPFYKYPRNTAPFLSSLSKKGVVFENTISTSSHTAPAHASIFTSLLPFEHGVTTNGDWLDGKSRPLEQRLKNLGYKTAHFSAVRFMTDLPGWPVPPKEQQYESLVGGGKAPYLLGSDNTDRAIAFLKSLKGSQKFYVWLHLYDVHDWRMPDKKLYPRGMLQPWDKVSLASHLKREHNLPTKFFKSDNAFHEAIDEYDARIQYVDDQLKRLHTYLEEAQLNSSTLWVVTGDHGEGLGNHMYPGHGEFLYQEQLRVPLMFYSSSPLMQPGVRKQLVSIVDILPTLFDLLPAPANSFKGKVRGKSLVPFLRDKNNSSDNSRYVFAQRRRKEAPLTLSWLGEKMYSLETADGWKLIFRPKSKTELYNLNSDPFELEDLFEKEPEKRKALKAQIFEILNNPLHNPARNQPGEMDPEVEESLKALNYL